MTLAEEIADAMTGIMAEIPECTVKAVYSRAGQEHRVSGIRSSISGDASIDGGGIHRSAKGALRVLVADLGKAPPEVADPITITEGNASTQYQIVDLRYDAARATLLISCGDQYA